MSRLPPNPPEDPGAQLRWLVDRAAIEELFYAFGRAIDDRDQASYAECFTEDGVVTLPHGTYAGQAAIRAMRGPPPQWATQHLQGNHYAVVTADSAEARVYVLASHAFARETPHHNARAGGWYDAALRRTPQGWRIASIALHIVWNTGEMVPPGGMPPPR